MEGPQKGYFPTVLALGKQYTPEDTYRGVRLGCAELIYSGVTTVHDWAHNIRSPAHADADVRALIDTGIRGRFSYGTYQGGPPPDDTMDIADLERMHRDWSEFANEGLLTLGMASRSVSHIAARRRHACRRSHATGRRRAALKLPITLHTGGTRHPRGAGTRRLLGPDVQLINTSNWNDADRARIVKSGAMSASRRIRRCAIPTRCRSSWNSSSSASRSASPWTRRRSPAPTTCSRPCA